MNGRLEFLPEVGPGAGRRRPLTRGAWGARPMDKILLVEDDAAQQQALASLLSASHASLRDQYQISTPAVEATVEKLLRAGAAGARLIGGGFGGSVLGLLEPGLPVPILARDFSRVGKNVKHK